MTFRKYLLALMPSYYINNYKRKWKSNQRCSQTLAYKSFDLTTLSKCHFIFLPYYYKAKVYLFRKNNFLTNAIVAVSLNFNFVSLFTFNLKYLRKIPRYLFSKLCLYGNVLRTFYRNSYNSLV